MTSSPIRKAYSVVSGQLQISCDGQYGLCLLWLLTRIILQVSVLVVGLSLEAHIINGKPFFNQLKMIQDKMVEPCQRGSRPLNGNFRCETLAWPDCKSALPPIIPPYNLTDHIPQIAGSACGPGVVFMVNGRSTFSFHFTLSHAVSLKLREKILPQKGVRWGKMGQI